MRSALKHFAFCLMALAWFACAPAQADSTKAQHVLKSQNEVLKKAEDLLKLPDLTPEQLQELRSELDSLRAEALTQTTALEPDLKDAENQIKQLGPKPEKGEEDPAIAEKRTSITAALTKLAAQSGEPVRTVNILQN